MAQTPSDASMQGPGGTDEGTRVMEGSAELNQNTRNTRHILEAGSNQLSSQIQDGPWNTTEKHSAQYAVLTVFWKQAELGWNPSPDPE